MKVHNWDFECSVFQYVLTGISVNLQYYVKMLLLVKQVSCEWRGFKVIRDSKK